LSHQDINEKVFERLNEIELKKVGKQIEKSYPNFVLRAFPKDKILNASQAVTYLKKETNLNEGVVRNCLADLIDKKELIPSRDSRGRLHLSKMKKLY
jgi:hypothetical protein